MNTHDLIRQLLHKFKFEYHIYESVFFERRQEEEFRRSEHFSESIVTFHILFQNIFKGECPEEMRRKIWVVILQVLADFVRGSDIKGFLPHELGLGVMLLDSEEGAVERIGKRIEHRLLQQNLDEYVYSFSDGEMFREFIFRGKGQKQDSSSN